MQARAVGRGFAEAARTLDLKAHACAILPDHVHLVAGRHARDVEYLVGFLKRAATRRLTSEGLHPLAKYRRADNRVPSPWVDNGWSVYLNTPDQMRQRIRYVEENPIKEGLAPQSWGFVIPYES